MKRELMMNNDRRVFVSRRWVYIVFGIVIMMFLGTQYSYSVFRGEIEAVMAIGSAISGIPYMTALAFYALFMFLTGRMIGREMPRKMILIGCMLVSCGWIFSAFADNIVLLTLGYGVLSGAGVGITYGVLMNLIARWFPDKKGLAVGLVIVGFGLSPLVMAPFARFLVEGVGVMKAFFTIGIGFFIINPILALFFRYPSEEERNRYQENTKKKQSLSEVTLKEMLHTDSFRGIYMNFVIGTMIGLMIIGMTHNVGTDHFKLPAHGVAGYMSIFAVFNGLGRPTFGWFTDHFHTRRAMFLSYFLIMSAAVLVAFAKPDKWIYLISFSIFWFNLGGWLAIAPTATLKHYGLKNYSQNYGLVFTAYGIGAIIGVLSSGILLDLLGGYQAIFYSVIIICFVGMGLTATLVKGQA